jgi:hypothetical protein
MILHIELTGWCDIEFNVYACRHVGKPRWCTGCAVQHTGALNIRNDKCEDCKVGPAPAQTRASTRFLNILGASMAETTMRPKHTIVRPNPAAGQVKAPSMGLPGESGRRWCAGCAKDHPGAANLRRKRKREESAGGREQPRAALSFYAVVDGHCLPFLGELYSNLAVVAAILSK